MVRRKRASQAQRSAARSSYELLGLKAETTLDLVEHVERGLNFNSVERLRESKSEPGEIAVYRPTIATAAAERDPVNRPREPLNITREDLEKRQQRELGELQSRHENERKMLEDLQKREIERPPEGSNADQIKRDHDAERKMLDEQHRREMDIQKRAHENERQHLPPPPRPQEPARPHKPGA